MNTGGKLLFLICVLVIAAYAYLAQSPAWEWQASPDASTAYYNLLVQGFRAGQLSLKKDVPVGLTQLANPYDPTANIVYRDPPYRMHDLSYYKGKLFLYFGVTPAVMLFWPFVTLTGHYLFHRQAVVIFCALGFIAGIGLLRAVWRRYFPEVSVAVVLAGAVALGFATGVPVLLSWAGVYEVPISCGYMLTMLALAAIWCALHEPGRRCRWLAAASLAYGLAVGARPSLLFGAVILLVPVAQAWREPRKLWPALAAAIGPIALIGSGLMLYNQRRFGSPFEFGLCYQLGGPGQFAQQFFSPRYLWFNFEVYFLDAARWSNQFPFVHDIVLPPLPAGYTQVGRAFGVLANIPLAWLALAAPLACRSQSGQTDTTSLRWFVTAVALLFAMCVLPLELFCGANFRYEVDFLPALLLLAMIGVLGLERVLADRPPPWRWAARCGWGLLLVFSVAFNLLASVTYYAEGHNNWGSQVLQAGRLSEAVQQFQQAVRLMPEYAEAQDNLGIVLGQVGNTREAIEHFEAAVRINPDFPEAHYNLGVALQRVGEPRKAIEHYEQALHLKPDYAEAHYNLAVTLQAMGRLSPAIAHLEQAIRSKPDYAEAHCNLGIALAQVGKMQEAIGHFEEAVRIKPNFAEAQDNLGIALGQAGKVQEAIGHFEEAVRIEPDFAEARSNLGAALTRSGRLQEAVVQYEWALRINPNLEAASVGLARVRELMRGASESKEKSPPN